MLANRPVLEFSGELFYIRTFGVCGAMKHACVGSPNIYGLFSMQIVRHILHLVSDEYN